MKAGQLRLESYAVVDNLAVESEVMTTRISAGGEQSDFCGWLWHAWNSPRPGLPKRHETTVR